MENDSKVKKNYYDPIKRRQHFEKNRQKEYAYHKSWKKKNFGLIPLKCPQCGKEYMVTEEYWLYNVKNGKKRSFCSAICRNIHDGNSINKKCTWCGKEIHVYKTKIRERNFCSRSCHGKYSARHKKHCIPRSKLEVIVEEMIRDTFPNLEAKFNDKEAVGYELDIYLPSLNLAFELNGPLHYRPIYGKETLEKVKKNDFRKWTLCYDKGIHIVSLDTSKLASTNRKSIQKYLAFIKGYIMSTIRNQDGDSISLNDTKLVFSEFIPSSLVSKRDKPTS